MYAPSYLHKNILEKQYTRTIMNLKNKLLCSFLVNYFQSVTVLLCTVHKLFGTFTTHNGTSAFSNHSN